MIWSVRPFVDADLDEVLELSLLAWQSVFDSFARVLGSEIYSFVYPDWRASQREGVAQVCTRDEKVTTLVAVADDRVVGFVSSAYHEDGTGEVVLLAVHPDLQNHGIGTALNVAALDEMRAVGLKMAVVGTGGDESHAPARRSYEKAGYTPLPLVRYYKAL